MAESTEHLYVCRTCARPYERGRPDGRNQGCDDRPPTNTPWPDTDHCMHATLCHLCASVVVPAGSRWDIFFCAACLPAVRRVNEEAGRLVVPVGRHTLVNGIGLRPEQADNPDAVATFVSASRGLFDRIDMVTGFGKYAVRKNLDAMRATADVPMSDYLASARPRATIDELVYAVSSVELGCAWCGSHDIVPIVYGLPTTEIAESDDVVLGGCIVQPPMPNRRCRACDYEFILR